MNINSVKFRLIFIIALVIVSLGLVAVMSTSGLRNAEANFEDLYTNGLGHSNRANTVLQSIGDARSQLLLAFQHDPDSKFVSMHDHPVSLHLDAVNDALNHVHKVIDNELLPNLPKEGEGHEIMSRISFELNAVEKSGFQKSISEINKGDYTEANRILLTVINPRVKMLSQHGEEFLALQIADAKETHARTTSDTTRFMTSFTLITIAASAIIVVLSWFIIRRIDSALQRVQGAAQKVSAGDLTLRVDLTGNDEFAVLLSMR